MKAKNPIEVFDPYQLMPGHGENEVSFVSIDSELIVEVFFDSKVSDSTEKYTLTFYNVRAFSTSSFPGVKTTQIEYDKPESVSSLNEYKKSDPADKWTSHVGSVDKIRHYKMYFLSENKQFEVFSSGFTVVDNNGNKIK